MAIARPPRSHPRGRSWTVLASFVALCFALSLFISPRSVVASSETETTVEEPLRPETTASSTNAAESVSDQEKKIYDEIRQRGETFSFQAEVSRMLNILINSLYTNKDIFLRELISNASDALDKLRYVTLTDKDALGDTTELPLEIRIQPDSANRMLHVSDSGIGMNKEELVANLGTIAQSGTRNFLEKLKEAKDMNMIGQFGVGFYSSYLVADSVTVASHRAGDQQYLWQSSANDNFFVSEDPRGATLTRGSRVSLHLKDDADEFLQDDKLKELIKKYSEFINYPIYLYASKTVEKEVEIDEAEEPAQEEKKEGEDAEPKKKTKTVKETVYEWQLINENKPIWTRNVKDVEEEEYFKFYRKLTNGFDDPLTYIHFKAEGDVEFRSILFVPKRPDGNVFEQSSEKLDNIKLYVRRVFITDQFDDLMPRYLGFIKGVVDSDDLPLNVSREILQQSRILRTIKKKLVRKVLEMLRKVADNDKTAHDEYLEKVKDKAEGEAEPTKPEPKFNTIWEQFGRHIRLGIIEDTSNRARLAKLLRYKSTKSDNALTSLDEYVSRMKEGQKQIYFISAESEEVARKSLFLEEFKRRDVEVLFLTDPIDEYVVQHMTDFEDKKLTNIAKDGVKFDFDTEDNKEEREALEKDFKDMTAWWQSQLVSKVERVIVSPRQLSVPCVLVSSHYGLSANMERIMRAQALGDPGNMRMYAGAKVLEINPTHPLTQSLKDRFDADKDSESTKQLATILYETAALQSGYSLADSQNFAKNIFDVLGSYPSASASADVSPASSKSDSSDSAPSSESTSEEKASEDFSSQKEEL